MSHTPRLKRFALVSCLVLAASGLPAVLGSQASAAGKKTITAVMHSDLRVIDPIFTPAYICLLYTSDAADE